MVEWVAEKYFKLHSVWMQTGGKIKIQIKL